MAAADKAKAADKTAADKVAAKIQKIQNPSKFVWYQFKLCQLKSYTYSSFSPKAMTESRNQEEAFRGFLRRLTRRLWKVLIFVLLPLVRLEFGDDNQLFACGARVAHVWPQRGVSRCVCVCLCVCVCVSVCCGVRSSRKLPHMCRSLQWSSQHKDI